MPGAEAHCSECGHTWETRKPPEEIDRPRCSECGAHGDEIEFDVEDGDSEPKSEAIAAARRERRRFELRDRIDRLRRRLEWTAPEEADYCAAEEVRGEYRELSSLADQFDFNDDLSTEELEAISDRVDELEAVIDEHAEELDRVDRLADAIEELEAEKAELDTEVADLRGERDELKQYLEEVEDEAEAFDAGLRVGRAEARREFAVLVPCSICGEDITVKPGSFLHQAVVDFVHQNGWGHERCVNRTTNADSRRRV